MLQVTLKLLQKRHSHAESEDALERLPAELAELLEELQFVQKCLGKLLSSCPCAVALVAHSFVS